MAGAAGATHLALACRTPASIRSVNSGSRRPLPVISSYPAINIDRTFILQT